jgi:hypothetical protein
MTKMRDAVQAGGDKHPRLWPARLEVCVFGGGG